MADRIRGATRSAQLRSVFLLIGGTAAGQLIILVSLPLLTRLYPPAAFGIAAVFTGIIVPLNAVASFRYELAIPIPEEERKATDLLSASLLLIAVNSIVITLVILLVGGTLAEAAGVPEVAPYLWLLPVAFLGGGIYPALTYFAIRHKAFRDIASTRLSQGGGQVGAQALLGIVGWGAGGLVAGVTARFWAGMLTLLRFTLRRVGPGQLLDGLKRFRSTLVEYRRFPLLTGNATFIQLVLEHIPALIVASIYGPAVAGLLALSLRLLEAPVSMISRSAAQVYLSSASEVAREEPSGLRHLYARTAVTAALFAAPILVLVLLPAPWTFPFVFGEEWRDAGVYIQILSVMFFFGFLARTVGPDTLTVVGRQGLHLGLELLKAGLVALAFAVAISTDAEPVVTILLYGVAMSLGHVAFLATGYVQAARFADSAS